MKTVKYFTENEIAQWEKEMGLPELTGTEKQIEWANKIRAKRLPEIIAEADAAAAKLARVEAALPQTMPKAIAIYGSEAAARAKFDEQAAPLRKAVLRAEKARTVTSAGWWIDHR